ncbi:hypothetical protein [Methylobacterium mesophilicum]
MSKATGSPHSSDGHKITSPSVIRPTTHIRIDEVAKRIASRVTPELQIVKGFMTFSNLAATTVGVMSGDAATLVKDLGGAANAAAELSHKSLALAGMRFSGEGRALKMAAAHARVAGQIGFDLVRARVAVAEAEEAMRHFKSPAAESALVFMRPELDKLQHAFECERGTQSKYRDIAGSLQSKSSNFGALAHAAENTASKTMLGRGLLATGKMLSHPWVGTSLVALGVGIASIKGFSEAPTASNKWKIGYGAASGIAAGVSDLGLASAVAAGGNPLALFYDPAVKYGAKSLGYGDAGDKLTIGTFFENCSTNVVALTQGLTTGDMAPMSAVHKRNMDGAGSKIIQGYAMIGDAMSKSALVDTAITRVADWTNNVPSEFKSSPSWWSAIESDGGSVMDAAKGALMTLKGE